MAGKHSFLVIPLFLLFFSNLSAQTDGYFIFPQPLPNGNYTSSVGFIAAGLPEDQIEEASTMLRGPLFNYQGLYGLPNNFRIYGSIHTNIILIIFQSVQNGVYHLKNTVLH